MMGNFSFPMSYHDIDRQNSSCNEGPCDCHPMANTCRALAVVDTHYIEGVRASLLFASYVTVTRSMISVQ